MGDPKQALDWIRHMKSSAKPPTAASTPANPPIKSGNQAEWNIDDFKLVLDLVKQALDLAEAAPFVKSAAALLTKIIDSYKEGLEAQGELVMIQVEPVVLAVVPFFSQCNREKLTKWLESPPSMQQKQHDTEQLRSEGTGQWFLEDKRFTEWEDNPGVLWVEGPSGAGKSVISSMVISNLFEHQKDFTAVIHPLAVAFFYFDFRNKEAQSVETALRRIVLQLSAQSLHPYKTLDKHWNLSKGQQLPSYQDLVSLLLNLLHELGQTYVVLDALDECNTSHFNKLVDLVCDLKNKAKGLIHLFITSQPRHVFTEGFTDLNRIVLHSHIMDQDIKLFVTKELQTNSELDAWLPTKDLVTEQITQKSRGM
ncbi:Pfs domain-containing protein [Mycena sanguinolenta]|uniref:Pfs domain-containing protein n=1 Tax=Mycena sanguinolenta TaxID=230812 RepID=A0A8H6XXR2_9AGAR|nr:Pfs domain-containing protein [Mycena sanguinolenta]